jgi:hypothetical protein
LVFLVLISIAGVSAVEDVNQTDLDLNFDMSDSECNSLSVQEESVLAIEDVNQTDSLAVQEENVSSVGGEDQTDSNPKFSRLDSECCSFVIQEEDETVFAFRQDAALNGRGVLIRNQSLGDMDVIIQEIDSPNGHFIHAIITEDGWVVGHGGDSSNVSDTLTLETLALEMLRAKAISNESIRQISKIFDGDLYGDYGHFVIKAPDGRYAVAYGEACIFGTLKTGEFLVVPNLYANFHKGNYSDYGMDPVEAIIEICSYEDTGFNRRNLYTYDYKAHRTANGQKYGVDIYVTNDNGHNVGLNTSKIVCYCYFNDARYQESVIPQNPGRLQIGTHIFEKQTIDSHIQVVSNRHIVYVGNCTPVRYRINNIVDERTVVFDIEADNAEFINAVVFQGNWSYDSTNHKLYWDLPATNASKEIILTLQPSAKGFYKIRAHIEGIDEEVNVTSYVTTQVAIFRVEDCTTYKSYFNSMKVYLTDEAGVPYIGEKVSITVNGITYSRKVTPNGYAGFAIMLQPGEYDVSIYYGTEYFDNDTSSKIIVNKTLFTDNMFMSYGNDTSFDAYCLDEHGNPQLKGEVDFYLNGVMYQRYTDNDGIGGINLTLRHLNLGNHTITSFNVRTNEYVTNWIYVYDPKTELEAKAVTATYNVNKELVITLKGDGKGLSGVNITVDLNGVKSYTTDEDGQVKINVANLVPNIYTAKIAFAGNDKFNSSATTAKVIVKKAQPRIVAKMKTFNAKTKTKTYAIVLKDNKGKAIKNAKVTLKISGKKIITVKTDSNGKATFKITNLAKKGTYAAIIKFAGDKYYNAINKNVKIAVK